SSFSIRLCDVCRRLDRLPFSFLPTKQSPGAARFVRAASALTRSSVHGRGGDFAFRQRRREGRALLSERADVGCNRTARSESGALSSQMTSKYYPLRHLRHLWTDRVPGTSRSGGPQGSVKVRGRFALSSGKV